MLRHLILLLVLPTLTVACSAGGLSEARAKKASEEWVAAIPHADKFHNPVQGSSRNIRIRLSWAPLVQDSKYAYHADVMMTYDAMLGDAHPYPVHYETPVTLEFQRATNGRWIMTARGQLNDNTPRQWEVK